MLVLKLSGIQIRFLFYDRIRGGIEKLRYQMISNFPTETYFHKKNIICQQKWYFFMLWSKLFNIESFHLYIRVKRKRVQRVHIQKYVA